MLNLICLTRAKENNFKFQDLTPSFLWKTFLRKGDIKRAPDKLAITAKEIESYLIEPLTALNKGIEFSKGWKASGTWK